MWLLQTVSLYASTCCISLASPEKQSQWDLRVYIYFKELAHVIMPGKSKSYRVGQQVADQGRADAVVIKLKLLTEFPLI